MQFFGMTDIGRIRDNNQDSFFAERLFSDKDGETIFLAVVCDGMGGANGGSTASSLAVETFVREVKNGVAGILREKLPPDTCESILTYAIGCANRAVYTRSREDASLRGMGTTLVAMLLFRETVYAVNVGDSRLYIRTESGVCQLTHDHSYVQTLVDQGKITPEQAQSHPNKNVIMRAVGTEPEVHADFFKILPDRKSFLLCSDGLSNFVSEEDMQTLITRHESPEEAIKALIRLANQRGGADNISAILVTTQPEKNA